MKARLTLIGMTAAIVCLGTASAWSGGVSASGDAQQLAEVVPGKSTKSDIAALLGAPWRVMQFNDCGMAMGDQSDETWEYRGTDVNGAFRIHVEFGDDNVVHLVAKIPDNSPGGAAAAAKVAPAGPMKGMSM